MAGCSETKVIIWAQTQTPRTWNESHAAKQLQLTLLQKKNGGGGQSVCFLDKTMLGITLKLMHKISQSPL